MARIGSLFVNLALQDATFIEGLKKAKAEASAFGASVDKAAKVAAVGFAAVTAVAAVAAAKLIAPIGRAIDGMDDLSKSAQKVGTSVGELAKLRWAGALSDLSDEKLQTGLTKLNVALATLEGKASPAGKALKALGVTAGTDTATAIKILAGQFAAMPDGVQKSALAVQIFGKAGAELIPLLNSGEGGLAAAAAEASNLGLVLDTETARAAEAFNDNLTRLRKVQDGIIIQIGAGMVPALAAVTTELAGSLKVGTVWQEIGRGIANVALTIAEATYQAAAGYKGLAGAMIDYGVAVKQSAMLDFTGARETIQVGWFRREAEFNRGMARFAKIRADIANFKPGDPAATRPTSPDEDPDAIAAAAARARAAAEAAAKARLEVQRKLEAQAARLEEARGASFQESAARLTREAGGSLSGGLLDFNSLEPALKRAAEAIEKMNEPFEKAAAFGKEISANLAQAIVYGQSIGDALVNSFKAAAAEALANGLFDLLLGKGGGGVLGGLFSGIGAAFGGFRAEGGPISPGKAYMVGERGPEMIISRGAGTVISNAALAGAGGTTINVDARGANDADGVARAVAAAVSISAGVTNQQIAKRGKVRLGRVLG